MIVGGRRRGQNKGKLFGESMGLAEPDRFKELKLMRDADAILAASKALIDAHGLDLELVRDVVVEDMLGRQTLPVERASHPAK